jgi:uncharacterized protein YrzB (UPF0473 family)
MEREPDGTIITLLDEEGNEHEFEHLASLEHKGSTYVALIPAFDSDAPEKTVEDDGELLILKVVVENGEELLSAIEDDLEFAAVSEKFEELLDDEYQILDGDEEHLPEDEDENEDEE